MSQAEQLHFMEPDEFLAFEQHSDVKHEYVDGFIIAMAGASRRHNLLTLAFAAMLREHLRGTPCQTYVSDMKVNASHKGSTVFYYPDVMVTCQPLVDGHDQFVEHRPQLVVEVLSPTTEARDRMEKLAAYTATAGVKEYILVCQDRVAVDVYQNTAGVWEVVRYRGDDTVVLNSIGFSATLQEIYQDVLDTLPLDQDGITP